MRKVEAQPVQTALSMALAELTSSFSEFVSYILNDSCNGTSDNLLLNGIIV